MNTTKRILWIDYTKAICIYLVLLGHAHVSQPIADFIYSFHMPLFFFLSGCLFSYDKHPTFREFALKRFKGLMVPYLWINLFTYLFWLLIGKNFGEDSSISIPWYSPLIGILTGNGKLMIHNTPMWFFLCLYLLEIIYYPLFKPLQNRPYSTLAAILLTGVAGYINYTCNPVTLPFCMGPAIVGMTFYGTGNLMVRYIKPIQRINLLYIILLLATFFTVFFISRKNGYVIMSTNDYKNYLFFFIGSLAGIGLICSVGNLLSLKPVFKNTIIYISQNTLLINSFHLLVFSFMKGIMVFGLHIPLESLYANTTADIVFSFISLFLCLPVAYIVNRYFPFIVGKKRVRTE